MGRVARFRNQSTGSRAESGHALLESALVMPLMIFFVLGLVQFTTIQHAKILTEYAAFNAARAGIVWNGSHQRMQDAAALSLLSTDGRTDDWSTAMATWARFQIKNCPGIRLSRRRSMVHRFAG